jgi:predicted nucleic acid-binding protein
VYPLTQATLLEASELRGRYAFSFWDSVLVATALQTDVTTLFSEDMQDGLMVEERLKITNPFA